MKKKKNKIELRISNYQWNGKEEYTYEIIGYNIYFSEVGFSSYDEAKKKGKLKLKQ